MWSRQDIKSYAKDFLRQHYWKAFLVCLIASLLTGDGASGGARNNYDNYYNNQIRNEVNYEMPGMPGMETFNMVNRFVPNRMFRSPIFSIFTGFLPIILLLFMILLITVGFAIEVGKVRFFLRGFEGDVNVGSLFSTFNSVEYFRIVQTQFLRGLYNILWTFLFIIPGIIKVYEYRMVPYILSEEPYLLPNEAIRKSRDITRGHKMDMFILDLSFLGWDIAGSFLFGIGHIFVNPYKEATKARLYNILAGNDNIEENLIF